MLEFDELPAEITVICLNGRVAAAILGLVASTCAHGFDYGGFWCRNGVFASEQRALQLANVAGQPGTRLSIYWDEDGCPEQAANCRPSSYVNPGDELIVNHVENGWACAWYQGKTHED